MDDHTTRWSEVAQDLTLNPFDIFATILTSIGMDQASALWSFNEDYQDADSWYSVEQDIRNVFTVVLQSNSKKYAALIAAAPFSKYTKRIRTPELTRSISGAQTGTVDVNRKQTETQTETPNGYGQTRTHNVAPYDTTTFKAEYQDSITNNGSRTVSTSYTGDPDHTETGSEAYSTDIQTGTETTTEETIGSDRLTPAETMADMAAAATIFDVIKRDIAKKLFIQVWR